MGVMILCEVLRTDLEFCMLDFGPSRETIGAISSSCSFSESLVSKDRKLSRGVILCDLRLMDMEFRMLDFGGSGVTMVVPFSSRSFSDSLASVDCKLSRGVIF
jgi:hypothetical protein